MNCIANVVAGEDETNQIIDATAHALDPTQSTQGESKSWDDLKNVQIDNINSPITDFQDFGLEIETRNGRDELVRSGSNTPTPPRHKSSIREFSVGPDHFIHHIPDNWNPGNAWLDKIYEHLKANFEICRAAIKARVQGDVTASVDTSN
ncbi:hypothetical protein RSOL_320530, partial [Rhizoctonia solani AG-3 Rhs1AP]